MNNDKKFLGLWLDHEDARLIATEGTGPIGDFSIIRHVKAHHRDSRGSSENAQHHSIQEERKKFFQQVTEAIKPFDDILIFGPGTAQEELRNHLTSDKDFHGKKLSIDTAGNLTENQVIAKVRDFFKQAIH